MIVPTEVRPGTAHAPSDCWCGHTHAPAPPVLKGPAGWASRTEYMITDGRLYQQVRRLDAFHLETGASVDLVGIVRTVGTIERPAA